MSTVTLSSINGSKPTAQPWLMSSVQTFFTSVNWEDHSPTVQEVRLTLQETTKPLSLTMSVSNFFAAINWDNAAIAATPAAQPGPANASNDLTLDDFSSMF